MLVMADVAPVRSFSSPAWFHAFRCVGGAAVFMGSSWCCSDLVTFGVVMAVVRISLPSSLPRLRRCSCLCGGCAVGRVSASWVELRVGGRIWWWVALVVMVSTVFWCWSWLWIWVIGFFGIFKSDSLYLVVIYRIEVDCFGFLLDTGDALYLDNLVLVDVDGSSGLLRFVRLGSRFTFGAVRLMKLVLDADGPSNFDSSSGVRVQLW
ncbi:hypothetical protein QL285_076549 [Trifolium repens]|nr:hypothetical protein QL285_076549 [Trifolium repens]